MPTAEERRGYLAAIVESARDAIVGTDLNGIVTSWNASAGALFGYAADEMIGTPVARLMVEGRAPDMRCPPLRPDAPLDACETVCRTRDGRAIDVSVTRSPIIDTGGRRIGTALVARDTTGLREREREIARLSRLFAALSEINQAIVRTPERDALLRTICRVLVEQGGFRMAWIGWFDAPTGRLVPRAACGDAQDYLRDVAVYADDRAEGHGPSGIAFRSGRAYVCNDVRSDPATLPWRTQLERRGWLASAAFPFRLGGDVCGVLSVYADQRGVFHDQEIALLEETAVNVSFALDNAVRDAARRRAEQTLRNEKQFSDTMIESMPGVLYFYDEQGRFLRWNRNFETATGYSGAEIARMHPHDFFAGEGRSQVAERIVDVFARGEATVEAEFIAKDGTATPYFFTGRRVQLEGQTCLVGVGIDIADRRRAEARVAESERKYRELVEHANSIILRWSVDGRIIFLNEFGQRFFGYAAEEIVGRDLVGSIVPPTESGGRDLRQMIEAICAAPEAFEQNINENLRRNGDRVWIAWANRIVRDAGGRVVEFLSVGHDITARRHAETALREAELRFHTLFSQTPVGVVVIDPASAAILECNAQAARQLGYTAEALAALRLFDVAVREDETREHIERIVRDGMGEFETQHRTRTGETRDVFVSARLLELSGRRMLHCVFLDVTERKRAEARIRESEAHLVEAQRIAKIGSWELDLRRNRLRWSDQIYAIFGIPQSLSASTVEGFLEFVHPADRERVAAAHQAALAGQAQLDIEHRIVLRDGSEKVVHELAHLKTDADGAPVVLAGTVHDISDRVRVRIERERRQRAEAADRIKSAFLATMSHELRTPLNSIIGFTGILLQGLAGPLNAEQSKQLGMVRGSARHLLELINDVLDISKIEAGQLDVRSEPFDLPASIEKVTASVRPALDKKGLTLTVNVCPELGEMVSDRRRVEQILLNLLNNAIKFTDHGGVTLTVEPLAAYQQQPDAPLVAAVRLRVADTGIGITPADLASLFQPFRQLDTGLSRQHDGTGLGLAICRRLAELLGGTISADSEWQHGSTFTVMLPLEAA